jgi:ketosteroid isomerase-like protein
MSEENVEIMRRGFEYFQETGDFPIDMTFGMVFTLRDGKQIRMQMYSDPAGALAAVGLTGLAGA